MLPLAFFTFASLADRCNQLILHLKSEVTFNRRCKLRYTGVERHCVAALVKRSVLLRLALGQLSQFGCSITASESESGCGVDREKGWKTHLGHLTYVRSFCVYIVSEPVPQGHRRPHTLSLYTLWWVCPGVIVGSMQERRVHMCTSGLGSSLTRLQSLINHQFLK